MNIECCVCRANFAPLTNRGKLPSRCPNCYAHDRRVRPSKEDGRENPRRQKYTCQRCRKVKNYVSAAPRTLCGECARIIREQSRVFTCDGCGDGVRDGRVGFCVECRPSAKAKKKRAYDARRRREDPFYMLMGRVRSRLKAVRAALTFRTKLPRDLEKVLGYTADDLREHLESLFSPEMAWEDLFTGRVHIDHKRPVSSFDWSNETRFEHTIRECWSLSNLQPLWAIDNLRKGAAWANEVAFI